MEHSISFEQTGRYFSEGNHNSPSHVWLVLHGYGQLAKYFLKKFSYLSSKDHNLIIAAEGLHRFYLKGSNGRVGASWMTAENRMEDISNYLQYLSKIVKEVKQKYPNATINLLGFSQGAATACRLFQCQPAAFKKLVLHSSVFPPDLDFDLFPEQVEQSTVYFAFGNRDPYLNDERLEVTLKRCKDLNCNVIAFEGAHDISDQVLQAIS